MTAEKVLRQVGDSFTVISEIYGVVVYTTIGILDFMAVREDQFEAWSKYHPVKHPKFSAVTLTPDVEADTCPDPERVTRFFVSVPLASKNASWSGKGTPYGKSCPRQKKLPIAASDKDVAKWIACCEGFLISDYLSLEENAKINSTEIPVL